MNRPVSTDFGFDIARIKALFERATHARHGLNGWVSYLYAGLQVPGAEVRSTLCRGRNQFVLACSFFVATLATADWARAGDVPVAAPSYLIFLHGGEVISSDCCSYPIIPASEPYWFVGGAFSTPIGEGLGFQLDLTAGQIDDEGLAATSAHLFTRDAARFMFGVFASSYVQEAGHAHLLRLGLESELYVDELTLLAQAGYRYTDFALPINSQGGTARPFFGVGAKWYPHEDLMLGGSVSFYRYGEDPPGSSVYQETLGRLTVEWQPEEMIISGLSIRVDWTVAEDGYETLVGGVSYRFGEGMSLKRRDREYMISRDVPPISP